MAPEGRHQSLVDCSEGPRALLETKERAVEPVSQALRVL